MKFFVSVFLIVTLFLFLSWWKHDFALPLFCTTRGCVTSIELEKEKKYHASFSNMVQSEPPTESAVLTTLVRKHLILNMHNSQDFSQEAIKYRTDVLHLTDEEHVKKLGFNSFLEYDNEVTIPFLLQQAYLYEHGFGNPRETYINLSKNYSVFSLLFKYTWDSSIGEVVAR